MALGATARDVFGLVLLHGDRLIMIGVALGVAMSFAVTRVLASMLFEVDAHDRITFGAGALVLVIAAILAG